jgi:succinate dehydrogenase/fumarate reductase flavoprotein subunit
MTDAARNAWDRETDVLVFGAGAAGMTAALVATHARWRATHGIACAIRAARAS